VLPAEPPRAPSSTSGDIREVRAEDILEACKLEKGEVDVLDGSPPCTQFSTAGKRQKSWGKVVKYHERKQRVDDLFFEFARLVEGVQPKVFIAENVSGLVKGVCKGYFKEIMARLTDCGYRVRARLLDAQWLGVPQRRQRVIIIGVREDLDVEPLFPVPLLYRYSVRDACPWIGKQGGNSSRKPVSKPASKPANTITAEISEIDHWVEDLPDDVVHDTGGKFMRNKPVAEEPSPTIQGIHGCSSRAGTIHPTERRKFTIAELKRICGFPDDFELTGSYAQQWARLGCSVPPVMMRHIAEAVKRTLDRVTHRV